MVRIPMAGDEQRRADTDMAGGDLGREHERQETHTDGPSTAHKPTAHPPRSRWCFANGRPGWAPPTTRGEGEGREARHAAHCRRREIPSDLLRRWTATAARDGCRRWASPSSASTAGWPSTAPGRTLPPSPSSSSPTSPSSSSSAASTCSSAPPRAARAARSRPPSGASPRSSRSCSHPRSQPSCRSGRSCSSGPWGSSPSLPDSTPSSSRARRNLEHDHIARPRQYGTRLKEVHERHRRSLER